MLPAHIDTGKGMRSAVFEDGVYRGTWLDGKRHGIGKFSFINGDNYIGNWEKDQMHGAGTYLYKDFSVFEGQYWRGARHGVGLYKPIQQDPIHEEWVHGTLVASGKAVAFDGFGEQRLVDIVQELKSTDWARRMSSTDWESQESSSLPPSREAEQDELIDNTDATSRSNDSEDAPSSHGSEKFQSVAHQQFWSEAGKDGGVDSVARYFRAKRGYANFVPCATNDQSKLILPAEWSCVPVQSDSKSPPKVAGEGIAGVGIVFTCDDDGHIVVKRLIEGGSAEWSGKIMPGDRLVNVGGCWDRDDAEEAPDIELQNLSRYVKGPSGTRVVMKFGRDIAEREQLFEVELMRGSSTKVESGRFEQSVVNSPPRRISVDAKLTTPEQIEDVVWKDETSLFHEIEPLSGQEHNQPFWVSVILADDGRMGQMALTSAQEQQDYNNIQVQLVYELSRVMVIPQRCITNFRMVKVTDSKLSEMLQAEANDAGLESNRKTHQNFSKMTFDLVADTSETGWTHEILREWQVRKAEELKEKVKMKLLSTYDLNYLNTAVRVRGLHEKEIEIEGPLIIEQLKSVNESKAIWSQKFLQKFGNPSIMAMTRDELLALDGALKESQPLTAVEIEFQSQFFVRKRLNALRDGDRLIVIDRTNSCIINETAESTDDTLETAQDMGMKGRVKKTSKKAGVERKRIPFDRFETVEDDPGDPTFLKIAFQGMWQQDYDLWFSSERQKRLFIEILRTKLPRRCFWGLEHEKSNMDIAPSMWAKGLKGLTKRSKGGTASFVSRDGGSVVSGSVTLSKSNIASSYVRITGKMPGVEYDKGGHPIPPVHQGRFQGNTEHPEASMHPLVPPNSKTPALSNQQAAYIVARKSIAQRFYGESVMTADDDDDSHSQSHSYVPESIHDTRAPSEASFKHPAFAAITPYRTSDLPSEYPSSTYTHAQHVQAYKLLHGIHNTQLTEIQVQQAVKNCYFAKASNDRYMEVTTELDATVALKRSLLKKHFTDKGINYKASSYEQKAQFETLVAHATARMLAVMREERAHKQEKNS